MSWKETFPQTVIATIAEYVRRPDRPPRPDWVITSAGLLTCGSMRPGPSHRDFATVVYPVCSPLTVAGAVMDFGPETVTIFPIARLNAEPKWTGSSLGFLDLSMIPSRAGTKAYTKAGRRVRWVS